ncbi:hypothetical protein HJC23_003282 [Cyclotella cryptica]|uniref:Ubiquitin-like domain-containing protein n=1 Tax=Cyclotella cryptica TaxID=29204 RepID=A0ABD3QXR7_9STRA|eukprot:CCRYP_000815-RA/>CCRYP_000815-RA protein AED:0.04 eAED:0.04 QI:183/1/1/1/0.5/0.33/3/2559/117
MSSEGKDYIIVKRRNQTFFILVSPTSTSLDVKTEISKAIGQDAISPPLMRLYLVRDENNGGKGEEEKLLPDAATLADHEVKNAEVLYVTFPKGWEEGGAEAGGDWETVSSVSRRDNN